MSGALTIGDCIAGMGDLPADSIDAVVTDPPYGYGIGGQPWDSFKNLDAFEQFTSSWALAAHRVLKRDGLVAVFAAPRLAHRSAAGLEKAGLFILDQVVWLFGNGLGINAKFGRLKPGHELIILAAKNRSTRLKVERRQIEAIGQPRRNPSNVMLSGKVADELDAMVGPLTSGARRAGVRSTIGMMKGSRGDDSPPITASKGSASRYFYVARDHMSSDRPAHVTVKPVSVMEWVIGLVADPGDVVLDPFIGSGSTAIAAELCGCKWLGFEIDAQVAIAAQERIASAGRQPTLPFQ